MLLQIITSLARSMKIPCLCDSSLYTESVLVLAKSNFGTCKQNCVVVII